MTLVPTLTIQALCTGCQDSSTFTVVGGDGPYASCGRCGHRIILTPAQIAQMLRSLAVETRILAEYAA